MCEAASRAFSVPALNDRRSAKSTEVTANDRLLHFMARLPCIYPSPLLSRTISPQPCILPGKNLKEGGLSKFFAQEVHHVIKCHDDPALQMDPGNLESLCAPCHAPLRNDDRRGFSYATDNDGYAVDQRHPSNRPRLHLRFGTDATKLNRGGI